MGSDGEIVVVAGGCGFVGSHVVELLANGTCKNIAHVRIVDIQPEPTNLDQYKVEVTYYHGDITKPNQCDDAFEGATVCINAAAVVGTGFYDDKEWQRRVNVNGTQNLVSLCIKHNIDVLVHTSSSECCRGFEDRINATEDVFRHSLSADNELTGQYGFTKKLSQDIVLGANGTKLPNGKLLKTISLNPCGIYGDGDHKYIATVIKGGHLSCNMMPIVGNVPMQRVYVGNVAWSLITAMNKLIHAAEAEPGNKVDGDVFLVCDESDVNSNWQFAKPFLQARSIRAIPISIPVLLVYYFVIFMELLANICSPFFHLPMLVSRNEVYMAGLHCSYDWSKIRNKLGYTPFYSKDQAFERSFQYYTTADF